MLLAYGIFGLIVIVMGIISVAKSTGAKQIGIILIVGGTLFLLSSIFCYNQEITDAVYLAPFSNGNYILAEGESYIYKEANLQKEDEPHIIQKEKNVKVEIVEIDPTETPHMFKYMKQLWTEDEYRYIFYIPAQE